jgi:hypothetical protein
VRLTAAGGDLAHAFPIEPTASNYEGPVGISTVLNVLLREAGFETASLYALTPFYAVANPHPHAMLALAGMLDDALGASTPVSDLLEQAQRLDRDVAEAIEQSEQLQTVVRSLEEQYDWMSGTKAALPPGPEVPLALPSSDEVISDVERFLEEQRGSTNGRSV